MVLAAVQQRGIAFQYASDEVKGDREVVLGLIEDKGDMGERDEDEGDFEGNTAEANLMNQEYETCGVAIYWKYHLLMAYCKWALIPSVRQRSVRNRPLRQQVSQSTVVRK